MVSESKRQAFGAQVQLNNDLMVTMGELAKASAEKAVGDSLLAVMDRMRDLIDPDSRFIWATVAPGGDFNADVPLDGRWQLDSATLISTTATAWPSSVGIKGLYSAEEVYLTQAKDTFAVKITIENSENLRIHNYDPTVWARVIVVYKRIWQEMRPGGVGER